MAKKENTEGATLADLVKPVEGFSIKAKGDFVTYLTIGKKAVVLNHGDKQIETHVALIEPASQEFLKELYDASPSYAALINAPDGYEAPWNKFLEK